MAMDPFLGKIASGVAQQVTNGQSSARATPAVGSPGGGDSPFQQLMDQMGTKQDVAAELGIPAQDLLANGPSFQAISAEGITPRPEYLQVGPQAPSGSELVVDMLKDLNQGQMNMDRMLSDMLYGGRQMSMQELLAIEARIFHYTQVFEIGVKTASEAVSSFRAVMNQQVQ